MLTIFPSRILSRPLIVWIDIELNNDSSTSSQYFNTNSERDRTINANYKTWINPADYLRFWGEKKDATTIMKADLAGAELINSAIDLRLAPSSCSADENIHANMIETNNSVHQATAIALAGSDEAIGSTRVSHDDSDTNETRLAINDDVIILHEDTSPVCKPDNPWMFKNTNATQLFRSYQAIICGMIHKHQTLLIESYIHELAAHTHTFVLCKSQWSSIAERVFSKSLLTDLTTDLVSEVVDLDLPFPQEELFTLTTTLSNLALGTTTREQTMLDLYIMSSKMAYGPKRIVRSVVNLLQKLPATPLKSHDTITETELWSTYYDPVLSCLVSDPDELVHLCWTNSLPNENGKTRPDAIISE